MKRDFKELDSLIDHLRAKGVVQYKTTEMELTILPEAPYKAEKEKKVKDEYVEKKKGADGLNAEEQRERYNRVIDAEE